LDTQETDLVSRRTRAFGAGAPLFYSEPVHIVAGEGVWLTAADGRRYLDMYNNVPCVGHAHPHVVAAMHRQAQTLNVHSRYLHDGVIAYAERLAKLHAEPIDSLVFTCSGTEASEVALQTARAVTGGMGIIATTASYHGNSTEVRKLSYARTRNDPQDPNIEFIPYPERFRSDAANVDDDALAEHYLAHLREAIARFDAAGVPFAGLMLCSILANEGLPDIPASYMSGAADIVHAAGGLFIADEVQAGFARTGSWWGYEVTGFVPDIVTMGKPMGNGLPLAAAAANSSLIETFRTKTNYFNTFASSPLQAAVGNAVIDVIEDQALLENVSTTGAYMRAQLKTLAQRCPQMGDVRGHGLFCGVDWIADENSLSPDSQGAAVIVNQLRDKGFLISNAGEHKNVLKIRPPLVFEQTHADLFLSAFEDVLSDGSYLDS
jgi:4-aminobutyrate aminotransferase-like enzyme